MNEIFDNFNMEDFMDRVCSYGPQESNKQSFDDVLYMLSVSCTNDFSQESFKEFKQKLLLYLLEK